MTSKLARKHQTMLQVRAILVLAPVHLRQFTRGQFLGKIREADDVQLVARELPANERIERHRDFFRRRPAAAQEHRARHVNHQHGAGLRLQLGAIDLEIGG